MKKDYVILASRSYESFADNVANAGGWRRSSVERKTFEGGDPYYRLDPRDIGDQDVVIIGGTTDPRETDEIMLISSTANGCQARSISIVVPYFGSQRQERVTKPGEHCPAKLDAIRFSTLPRPAGGFRVFLTDLHCEQIVGYFENGLVPVPIQCKTVLASAISQIGRDLYNGDWELFGADQGILKWAGTLGDMLSKDVGCGLKRRVNKKPIFYGLMGEVEGRNIVLFDDILLSGETARVCAEYMKKKGAKGISAVFSHAPYPESAVKKFLQSGLFDRVVFTDSHPRAVELASNPKGQFPRIETITALIAEKLVNPWWD